MSKWQTAIVVLAGLGSFLLVKLVTGGAGFLGGGDVLTPFFKPQPSMEQMAAQSEQQGLRMFDAMKQKMPAEYDEVVRQLQAIVEKNPPAAQRRDELGLLTASIIDRHAKLMHEASDDGLLAVLKSQLELLELVVSRETPATCARFVIQGPIVLADPDSQYVQAIDAASASMFGALAGAIENPQPIEPPTNSDWAEAGAAFLSAGGSTEELQSVTSPDPKDERLCPAMAKLYRAMLTVPGAPGRRVRADAAYEIAAD
ncbi:hypothetical protein ACHMW7_08945 [Aminobacter sp. UC22_36]|uniref:hypothetical protein n=1 Tax=Aminobacter sp. UC22_36 TaxID=3374549 RepID=UPI00375812E2